MRIPSGVTDQVIFFVAVDSVDYVTRETGLTTWTVYRARDTASATAYTTPTITELSSSNMPGVYKLLLDEDMTIGSGNDSEEMVFHITHTGMAPVTRTIELYRRTATAGETIGVASGAVTNVTTTATATAVTTVNGLAANVITSAAIATGAVDADALAADAVDEIFDEVVAGTTTFRMMLRGFAAALLGKASGLGTTTAIYRNVADTMPVITATVDVDGNRTAVTLDLDDTP